MASLQDRMIRAAKLDVQLYEEVEADQGAMAQAMTVVIPVRISRWDRKRKCGPGRNGQQYDCGSDRMVRLGLSHLFHRNKIPRRATDQGGP